MSQQLSIFYIKCTDLSGDAFQWTNKVNNDIRSTWMIQCGSWVFLDKKRTRFNSRVTTECDRVNGQNPRTSWGTVLDKDSGFQHISLLRQTQRTISNMYSSFKLISLMSKVPWRIWGVPCHQQEKLLCCVNIFHTGAGECLSALGIN